MPTRYHVAVRRPDDPAILVLADGSMPGFTLDPAPEWEVVAPVVTELRVEHGLDVVALRAAWVGEPGLDGREDRLYEAVFVGGTLPAGMRWVPLDALERRPTPLGRGIDAGALDPAAGDRQPWYRADWFADMTAWIQDRLAAAGVRQRGPVRQVRSWGRAALLTVETDRGRLWAKEVPSVFSHEIAVTGLLADIDPGIVPPLMAADASVGRLLMEEVAGPILATEPAATEAWFATIMRLAEVQRVLAADLDALAVAGVPRASLPALAARIPVLLTDDALGLVGRTGGLTRREHDRLGTAVDDLVQACLALADSPIGPSLEHGDLSAGQVIVGEMGPVLLDWSDSTITHPFLAAASFLSDPAQRPEALADPLREAYVDAWGHAADRAHASRAMTLAGIVHPLHMTQLHADRILPGLEQRWELAREVPRYLRMLLPRLGELPRILGG